MCAVSRGRRDGVGGRRPGEDLGGLLNNATAKFVTETTKVDFEAGLDKAMAEIGA